MHPRETHRAAPLRSPVRVMLLLWLCVLGAGCSTLGEPKERWRIWQEEDFEEFQELEGFDEFDEFGEFDEEGEGDAEVPTAVVTFDPLRGYNRMMFHFNDKLYIWVWDPLARAYRFIAPEGVRIAIGRFFTNAATPVRFVNDILQLEFDKAGLELGRLLVNTTIGIGGLFDPADSWLGWKAPPPEDFGQTLGSYGVGPGFHVVLPILGPSNLRDALSLIPDAIAHPGYYLSTEVGIGVSFARTLNYTSLHIGEYESLKEDALDPYTFIRDAYEQNRLKKIDE